MNLSSGGNNGGADVNKTTATTTQIIKPRNTNADPIESIILNILQSTYSHVGDDYLNSVVKEIATVTGVQTVMVHRLLTSKEYEDLRDNEGCPCIELISSKKKDKSREHSPIDKEEEAIIGKNKVEFMMVKACYSSATYHEAFKKYAAISISSLVHNSPQLQTLKYANYQVSQNTFLDNNSVYPDFKSFVGIRLDVNNSLPIGLITVMNDKPLTTQQIRLLQNILSAIQLRTKNEIEKIRQRDNLTMVKNAALQDAESKIKFLADMSHEIRTPMNAVIALTDLLLQERNSLNDEQAEHLEVIQTSGNHLLTVINDILDISKINHDPKFKLENRRFSLKKCVKDALNMARHQASMTQYNKLVCVAEVPPEVNDNIPLNQLIKQLENIDPLNSMIVPQQHTNKTVLPLLWKIDSDVPDHLMGDTMRLTQILLNLSSNAVKFTKSGGIRVKITRYVPPGPQKASGDTIYQDFKERYDAKIESIYTRAMKRKSNLNNSSNNNNSNSGAGATNNTIVDGETTEEEGGTTTEEDDIADKVILEISVTDTGIGMPADRLPRLFKSFSQIDISTARRYGGTGLGLAISSMLVNRMGGGLWVESEEGLGSRFALTLPLTIAVGRPEKLHSGSGLGSESSSTYTSSGMIASPPSPGSSVSDGGSSIGERSTSDNNGSNFINITPSSPSNSTGYFSLTTTTSKSSKYNHHNCNNTNLPWEPINIPSTPSPTTNAPSSFESTNTNYISSNTSTNNTPITINTNTTSNNRELQNMISKSNRNNNNNNNTEKAESDTNKTSTTITNTTTTSTTATTAAAFDLPSLKPKPRVTLAKQYHHRKSSTNNNEENLALLYPIKIMLAEDNVLNQKIAISILKRLGYQDVVIAGNGREALNLMRIHKFDVIFMDLYMPEMDGLEATRFIISERKHNVPPPPPTAAIEEDTNKNNLPPLLNVNDVYIIALTASASKQDRQICIDAGMNDFISKPFTMMEMKSALKNCASKRKKRKKQQLRDELMQKQQQQQLLLQQQQQELINNALLVKYNDGLLDDPMLGVQREEDDCGEEEDEDEEEEREAKCRSRSSSIGSTTTNSNNRLVDDPMNTSFDENLVITNSKTTSPRMNSK